MFVKNKLGTISSKVKTAIAAAGAACYIYQQENAPMTESIAGIERQMAQMREESGSEKSESAWDYQAISFFLLPPSGGGWEGGRVSFRIIAL